MSEIRHVVPRPDGGWIVVEDAGGSPALADNGTAQLFTRKRDAEAHAREIVREQGGGEVVLHTPAGGIVETSTVVSYDSAVPG